MLAGESNVLFDLATRSEVREDRSGSQKLGFMTDANLESACCHPIVQRQQGIIFPSRAFRLRQETFPIDNISTIIMIHAVHFEGDPGPSIRTLTWLLSMGVKLVCAARTPPVSVSPPPLLLWDIMPSGSVLLLWRLCVGRTGIRGIVLRSKEPFSRQLMTP